MTVHPLEGVARRVPVRLSGNPDLLREAAAGLPAGAATPEAVVARLGRRGVEIVWGAAMPPPDGASCGTFCRERGASSVEIVRADPSLLSGMQLGSYFHAPVVHRVVRRVGQRLSLLSGLRDSVAIDVAFWNGVRAAATRREWQRFARSSYVVLCYHRIAGEGKEGQERIDIAPNAFERQMRLLRRLGFRALDLERVVEFHTDPTATLPSRSVVITADDGFADTVAALRGERHLQPILFVPTDAVGAPAPWWWADGEPIASWTELAEFAADGGRVGSHARTHRPLPELDGDALDAELRGSLEELQRHVPDNIPALAYPHGQHDKRVRTAAASAGYRVAFGMSSGRNGAGNDRYALRRIAPKQWDGALAFAWIVSTGERVPWALDRLRRAH